MKNQFSRPSVVRNMSNISQLVTNIKSNGQKHILDLNFFYNDKKKVLNRDKKSKIQNRNAKSALVKNLYENVYKNEKKIVFTMKI